MDPLNLLSRTKARELYAQIQVRLATAGLLTGQRMADTVRFYRVLLEDVYKAITQHYNRFFQDLHARMVFIKNHNAVPPMRDSELHGLRILANGVAHESYSLKEQDYWGATLALVGGIAYFSGEPVPDAIMNLCKGKPWRSLARDPQAIQREMVEFDRCLVTEVKPDKNGDRWWLTCESESEMGTYTLVLRDCSFRDAYNYEVDFSLLASRLAPMTKLHVFKITKDSSKDGLFHASYETFIVVEPDLLTDVSTVAKCYLDLPMNGEDLRLRPDTRWGLMQKLKPVEPSKHLFTGTVANHLLDESIKNGNEVDWEKEIEVATRESAWDALRIGQAQYEEAKAALLTHHIHNFGKLPEKKSDDRDIIEPTYYAVRYGLFGRLDFLRTSASNPVQNEVYELKSGKADHHGLKAEHQMQTVGYHLLLRAVSRNQAKTHAAVFYSQAENDPVRNVTPSRRLEQHFCMTRSLYVAGLLALAEGNRMVFEGGDASENLDLPMWAIRDLDDMTREFGSAEPMERDYVTELVAFQVRELLQQKMGGHDHGQEKMNHGFASLWRLGLEEKRAAFAIVTDLEFCPQTKPVALAKSPNPTPGRHELRSPMTFRRTGDQSHYVSFRKGDIVILYPQTKDAFPALRNQVFKATIDKIDMQQVVLNLNNPQADEEMFRVHRLWCFERDLMESTHFAMMQSACSLLKHDPGRRQLFLGQVAPRFAGNVPIDLTQITKDYKPSQARAISSALSAQDFMLIQGPPGTGKTSRVLAETVLQLYKAGEVVFLLAFTNRAVEKLLESVKALKDKDVQYNIPLLRLSGDATDEDTLAFKSRGKHLEEIGEIVDKTRVIVGTISSFLRMQGSLPNSIPRQTLIIDEASQVLEGHVAGIIPGFERFILIGDHLQLPPVVTQARQGRQVKSKVLRAAGIDDLGMSVFERLWRQAEAGAQKGGDEGARWAKSMVTLEEHFRMHADIAELVAPNYLPVRLKLGNPTLQEEELPIAEGRDGLERRIALSRVLFIESPGGDERVNEVEAARVAKLVKVLQALDPAIGREQEMLGVITPWRAQISCILQAMDGHAPREIIVDTVERFQGSECRHIVLALATSTESLLGVLSSSSVQAGTQVVDRKLNVSLSRAKETLLILGESALLYKEPAYARIIDHIKTKGGYVPLGEANRLFSEI